MPLDDPAVPPYGPGLQPSSGPLGRVRDAVVRRVVMGAIEKQTLPPVNALRADLGLPALRGAADVFTSPPLVLYLTAEPFEYHRDRWPDTIVQVGPCEWEPSARVPDWVAELDGPVVLVTTSSEYQDDATLVRTAVAALADEPVTVVATLPADQRLDVALPPNARVERFVPHGMLLDQAVCAVTHGGMGATQKALARGVPVAVVPFGRDQLEVAARVVHAGAGARLAARRLSPDRLRDAVRSASRCGAGAAAVAAGYARAGGARGAADAVEARLLARPRVG
jgi:MGT family glycosyltransferase